MGFLSHRISDKSDSRKKVSLFSWLFPKESARASGRKDPSGGGESPRWVALVAGRQCGQPPELARRTQNKSSANPVAALASPIALPVAFQPRYRLTLVGGPKR